MIYHYTYYVTRSVTVIKPDVRMSMEKYPALTKILHYAAEHGVREPLYRLAVALDHESLVTALYDIVRYAGTSGFVPEGLDKEVNEIIDNENFEEIKRIAQSIIFDKFSFFIL